MYGVTKTRWCAGQRQLETMKSRQQRIRVLLSDAAALQPPIV
jgi:hypothetical protein